MEIGVDFVNKEDAGLLILVGVCWVKIFEYADLLGLPLKILPLGH